MATRDVFSEQELARLRGFLEITRAELIRYFTLTSGDEGFLGKFLGQRNVPRRSRCAGCGATHVLLPVGLLLRRADTAAVIAGARTARPRAQPQLASGAEQPGHANPPESASGQRASGKPVRPRPGG